MFFFVETILECPMTEVSLPKLPSVIVIWLDSSQANIGSDNGLAPSGTKPLSRQLLTQLYVANRESPGYEELKREIVTLMRSRNILLAETQNMELKRLVIGDFYWTILDKVNRFIQLTK